MFRTPRSCDDSFVATLAELAGSRTTAAIRLGFLGVAAAATGFSQAPTTPSIPDSSKRPDDNGSAIIERARNMALEYFENLPNFVCTQVNRRFTDFSTDGSGLQHTNETVAEVRIVDRVESYRTVSVNGQPSDEEFRRVSATSGGFGRRLYNLFRPEARAVFQHLGEAEVDGREVAVFHVQVTEARYGFRLGLGDDSSGMEERPLHVGYSGSVSIDRQSGNVVLIDATTTLGIPSDYPVRQAPVRLEFGYVPIGERRYLLPVRARYVFHMSQRPYLHRIDVEWRACRKFDTESTLRFSKSTIEQE